MTKIIKEKLLKYPSETCIPEYYNRTKRDFPVFPLTLNEIRKMYWSFIKSKKDGTLEEAYQIKLAKHITYIENKTKKQEFRPELIGTIGIEQSFIWFETDEHPLLVVKPATPEEFNTEWINETIFKYETERCVNVIDNKIWTRLDLSK